MFSAAQTIAGFDPELADAMRQERHRQEDHIELIASENYASPRVLEAQGSVLTNKYAEGYPGKRYYGGCEYVDMAEQLAIDAREAAVRRRLRERAAALAARRRTRRSTWRCSQPGDTILGMSLAHGGHLTHGAKVNFSGKLFNAVQYGVDTATGLIDYDEVERLALEHKPKMIVAGFSAYSRVIDLGALSRDRGQRSARICSSTWRMSPASSPPACIRTRCRTRDVVTTTTHKTLRGPRGGMILAQRRTRTSRRS